MGERDREPMKRDRGRESLLRESLVDGGGIITRFLCHRDRKYITAGIGSLHLVMVYARTPTNILSLSLSLSLYLSLSLSLSLSCSREPLFTAGNRGRRRDVCTSGVAALPCIHCRHPHAGVVRETTHPHTPTHTHTHPHRCERGGAEVYIPQTHTRTHVHTHTRISTHAYLAHARTHSRTHVCMHSTEEQLANGHVNALGAPAAPIWRQE
jgi:hypothetical protein